MDFSFIITMGIKIFLQSLVETDTCTAHTYIVCLLLRHFSSACIGSKKYFWRIAKRSLDVPVYLPGQSLMDPRRYQHLQYVPRNLFLPGDVSTCYQRLSVHEIEILISANMYLIIHAIFYKIKACCLEVPFAEARKLDFHIGGVKLFYMVNNIAKIKWTLRPTLPAHAQGGGVEGGGEWRGR